MSLRRTIEVIVRLAETGTIGTYAIAGAVAALNYTQPRVTEDLDILVSVVAFQQKESGLLLLGPIESALAGMGYTQRSGVGIVIEGWPVQFIPVASPLDEEALERAIEVDVMLPGEPPLKARSLRAEHVVATALSLGRFKDYARVEDFLEQGALDFQAFKGVLERHNLMGKWRDFLAKAGKADPLV
ncbi:MAG: hypothetical protein HOP13_20940 [Alphaproteobacteria bacterium]|jgi:hypothetical protein|nr:hypothetical protein [Alphaproteobacteria bacterium]